MRLCFSGRCCAIANIAIYFYSYITILEHFSLTVAVQLVSRYVPSGLKVEQANIGMFRQSSRSALSDRVFRFSLARCKSGHEDIRSPLTPVRGTESSASRSVLSRGTIPVYRSQPSSPDIINPAKPHIPHEHLMVARSHGVFVHQDRAGRKHQTSIH